jgi:NDP-sugar pyrophosphorylase family protein
MRAGILAAGAGSRLRDQDAVPKPLRRVAGTPLIERVVEDLERAGATDVHIIINAESTAIREYLDRTTRASQLHWIVETTPSSMHSFFRVLESLSAFPADAPYAISTVDVVAPPGTFRRFRDRAPADRADVTFAVTSRIDEDRPLRIDIDERSGDVRAIGGGHGDWATAGYYLVQPTVLRERNAAEAAGLSALRAFFGHLHATGYRLAAVPMGDSVDVDSPFDIIAAEELLAAVSSRNAKAAKLAKKTFGLAVFAVFAFLNAVART